jgi:4-aminobutyrate aminotransferase-like enzyme
VTDRTSREPDQFAAQRVKEGLRRRGVLVGTTARAGNVLKVRPPLAFTPELIPTFVDALVQALDDLP